MKEPIRIPISKRKTLAAFVGSLAFVIAGVFFISRPMLFIRSDDPTMIRIIGYICTAFFGLCAILLFLKLRDKKEGLIIDAEGITDNSSGIAAGRILWKDVRSIRVEEAAGQQFIMMEVKDPLLYLRQQKNPVKKRAMELNYQLYKTPVGITANFLTVKTEQLLQLLQTAFKDARSA
ncbi:STM3941 family protein [Niabella beijingensis]|uniref:STM3941 family protein n=1 Tax=Niabella beijingensis TaxID=2872700 RepID=UPI001CBB7B0F|nr:STM3941 family protein [Niabella beijingensis]MBZ4189039.1 hypothetical protein [Niabella beijingensis]